MNQKKALQYCLHKTRSNPPEFRKQIRVCGNRKELIVNDTHTYAKVAVKSRCESVLGLTPIPVLVKNEKASVLRVHNTFWSSSLASWLGSLRDPWMPWPVDRVSWYTLGNPSSWRQWTEGEVQRCDNNSVKRCCLCDQRGGERTEYFMQRSHLTIWRNCGANRQMRWLYSPCPAQDSWTNSVNECTMRRSLWLVVVTNPKLTYSKYCICFTSIAIIEIFNYLFVHME